MIVVLKKTLQAIVCASIGVLVALLIVLMLSPIYFAAFMIQLKNL